MTGKFEIHAEDGCNGFTSLDKANDFNRCSLPAAADCGLKPDVRDFRYLTGFTLIEILIVVVLIGIAAMIAVPMMGSGASMQIRSAANMIAADLEYAKSVAISRGQSYSVDFDESAESYRIKDQAGVVINHPVKKGFTYIVNFQSDSRLDMVDIVNANFDGTDEIKFDYLGSPYNGNDNPLNNGVIILQAGDFTKTVRIEPVTGYISITD